MFTYIEVINKSTTYTSWWPILAEIFLEKNIGNCFSIHCWSDEHEIIQKSLLYGSISNSTWKYGAVISGTITSAFINFVLNFHPTNINNKHDDIKMTPFFNLFLGESFYSAHYGTEITFSTQSSNSKIDNIINSLLSQDIAVIYPLDE